MYIYWKYSVHSKKNQKIFCNALDAMPHNSNCRETPSAEFALSSKSWCPASNHWSVHFYEKRTLCMWVLSKKESFLRSVCHHVEQQLRISTRKYWKILRKGSSESHRRSSTAVPCNHGNVRAYIVLLGKEYLDQEISPCFLKLTYSYNSDLASCDFFLFQKVEKDLRDINLAS